MYVVGRLTKLVHIVPTRDRATAVDVAQLFLDTIFRNQGFIICVCFLVLFTNPVHWLSAYYPSFHFYFILQLMPQALCCVPLSLQKHLLLPELEPHPFPAFAFAGD